MGLPDRRQDVHSLRWACLQEIVHKAIQQHGPFICQKKNVIQILHASIYTKNISSKSLNKLDTRWRTWDVMWTQEPTNLRWVFPAAGFWPAPAHVGQWTPEEGWRQTHLAGLWP